MKRVTTGEGAGNVVGGAELAGEGFLVLPRAMPTVRKPILAAYCTRAKVWRRARRDVPM
jgi:hypothetical protein